jgi:hypothetical protein
MDGKIEKILIKEDSKIMQIKNFKFLKRYQTIIATHNTKR